MLTGYLSQKLKHARYKILKDGTFFGEIPGARGVWANARTLEQCRAELRDVLEEWVLLKVRNRERISGLPLKVNRRALVR